MPTRIAMSCSMCCAQPQNVHGACIGGATQGRVQHALCEAHARAARAGRGRHCMRSGARGDIAIRSRSGGSHTAYGRRGSAVDARRQRARRGHAAVACLRPQHHRYSGAPHGGPHAQRCGGRLQGGGLAAGYRGAFYKAISVHAALIVTERVASAAHSALYTFAVMDQCVQT